MIKKGVAILNHTISRFILIGVCVLVTNFNLILTCKVVVFVLYYRCKEKQGKP